MTKDEWAQVKQQATSPYTLTQLLVDGYKITLCLERRDAYHNVIAVYVNGMIDHKKLVAESDERRRFWREVKKTPGPKTPPKGSGITKKRWEQALKEHTYSYYLPWWTNFDALRRHLIANNTSIELLQEEETL